MVGADRNNDDKNMKEMEGEDGGSGEEQRQHHQLSGEKKITRRTTKKGRIENYRRKQ